MRRGVYALVTHDYDGDLTEQVVISSNELIELSKSVKSLNQLYVLDTCHAGGLNNLLSGLYDARMTVLARNTGLHLYASASSSEEAIDGYQGNGLFTHALLQGFNDRAADINHDGKVSVVEFGTYSRDKVIAIAKELRHRQNPLIINFGRDSPVYLVR
jgi:uncharacterized caspase-like protein